MKHWLRMVVSGGLALSCLACNFELLKPHPDPFYAAMLKQDQANPAALYAQGKMLLNQGRYRDAEKYFVQLTRVEPDHAAGWNALGRARLEQGAFKPAQAAFERQIELRPSDEGKLGLAEALLMQGKLTDAQRIADEISKSDGLGAELARLQGDLAYRGRDFAKAAEFYAKSLRENPNQAGLKQRLADLQDYLATRR
jgi:predicted Zn-dependent protease